MTKKRLLSYRQLKAELKWVSEDSDMCQALMTHSSGLFFACVILSHARTELGSRRHGRG